MFPGNSNVMGLDCHCGPHRSLFEDSASIRNARRSPWHCRPTRNPGIRSKWTALIVEHENEFDARPSIKKAETLTQFVGTFQVQAAGSRVAAQPE